MKIESRVLAAIAAAAGTVLLAAIVDAAALAPSGIERPTSWPHFRWDRRPPDPIAVGTIDGIETAAALPLGRTDVRARVVGPFVDVVVHQHFRNDSSVPVEMEYLFPLPDGAAIREMTIRVGDRTIRGEVLGREEADRTYREALDAGLGAAAMEAERPNLMRLRLGNVEPGAEIATRIRYLDDIPYDDGAWRLTIPTVVAPRYVAGGTPAPERVFPPYAAPGSSAGHDLVLSVEAEVGLPVADVRSPSHVVVVEGDTATGRFVARPTAERLVPDRDFVLMWRPAGGAPRASLFVGPPTGEGTPFALVAHGTDADAAARRAPRDVVFVLDTSGSMSGSKFDAAIRAMRALLRALEAGDRFAIVRFSSDHSLLAPAPLPFDQASLDRAEAWLAGLSAGGGTEMLPAVEAALRLAGRGAVLVLVTDGQVSNEDEVLAAAARRPDVRVFTLGIDSAANSYLLRRLAAVGRGRAAFALPGEDVEAVAETVGARLGRPVARDLRLAGAWRNAGTAAVWPDPLPDLHAGAPVVAYGLFRPLAGALAPETPAFRLEGADGFSIDVAPVVGAAPEGLAALVAHRRVEAVIDAARGTGDAEGAAAEAERIALAAGIASPFTAFVAVEERAEGERTDTRARVLVRVPVHFPAEWRWEGVFGKAAESRPTLLARAWNAVAASPASMVGEGQASLSAVTYGGSADAATRQAPPAASPAERALRYLARTQRADGTWARAGAPDRDATLLSALALARHEADRPGHPYAAVLRRALASLGLDESALEAAARPLLAAHRPDPAALLAAQTSGGPDDGGVGGDPLRTALLALTAP